MVSAKIAIAVVGVLVATVGAAPSATAEPMAGNGLVCQALPAAVGVPEREPGAALSGPSDPAWNAHVAYVEWALSVSPSTEELFTQPAGRWTQDRVRQQNAILDEYWQLHNGDGLPREGRAIIAGGVSGAGKTTVLEGQPAIERQLYLDIDPDEVKEMMAARSMIPVIAGLSPMEASAKAHEEASMLAKRLAERAYRQQTNVIWDITMSTEASVRDRMAAMREAGYGQIDGVFVETDLDTARLRVMQRWQRGQERYWSGEGLGGRYVPADFIAMSEPDKPGYSSRNQQIFEQVRGEFSSTVEYDSSGAEPIVRCVSGPRWM